LLGRIGQLANRIDQIQRQLRLLGEGEAAGQGLDFGAWLQQSAVGGTHSRAGKAAWLPQVTGSGWTEFTAGGRFDDIIAQAAARHGIDPDLIHAIIKVESDYNPRCVSSAGAKGLMQLMPGTARYLGVRDIFDPQQNIEGGVRYLKDQLERFGDPVLALAAYNAGPGAVTQYNGVPPYKETQAYVPRVMQYYEARIAARQHGAARPTPAPQAVRPASAEIAPAPTRSPSGTGAATAAQWVPEGPGEGIAQQPARPDAEVSSGLQRAAHSTLRQAPAFAKAAADRQGFQPFGRLPPSPRLRRTGRAFSNAPTSARATATRSAQIAVEAAIPHRDSSDAAKEPVLSVGQASRLSPGTLTKPAETAAPTFQAGNAEAAVVSTGDAARPTTARPAQIAPDAAIPHADSAEAAREPVLSVGQASRLSPVTLTKPAEAAVVSTGEARPTTARPAQIAPEAGIPHTDSAEAGREPGTLTKSAEAAAPTLRPGDAETAVASTGDAARATSARPAQIAVEVAIPRTGSTEAAKEPATLTKPAEAAVASTGDAVRATTARPAEIAPEAAVRRTDSTEAAREPVLSVGQASRLSPATLTKPVGVPGRTEGAERLVQGSAKPATSEGATEEHEPAASVANLSSMISSKMSVAIKDRLTELTTTAVNRPSSEGATSIARQHLTIELSPPELGRVHISFGLEQDAASVEVRTDNFNTAVHLDNSFKSLETSLEQLGLKLASLKVTCDAGGNFGPNYEGTAQPPPRQQQVSASWGALEPGNETQVTATAGDRRGHYSGVTERSRLGRLVSVLDVAG